MVAVERDRGVEEGEFEDAFDGMFAQAARLACRIVGDRHSAEDVAAEACARAYLRWSRLATLPWRDAWVLRVATNLALDSVRRGRPVPPEARQSDEYDAALTRAALVAALRQLPRRQREAICLHYLSDLPEEGVAQAMGISAGTAHTHIRRGLAALRSRLGTQFDDEEMSHAMDLP